MPVYNEPSAHRNTYKTRMTSSPPQRRHRRKCLAFQKLQRGAAARRDPIDPIDQPSRPAPQQRNHRRQRSFAHLAGPRSPRLGRTYPVRTAPSRKRPSARSTPQCPLREGGVHMPRRSTGRYRARASRPGRLPAPPQSRCSHPPRTRQRSPDPPAGAAHRQLGRAAGSPSRAPLLQPRTCPWPLLQRQERVGHATADEDRL